MAEDATVASADASPSGRAARFDGRLGALGVLMLRNLLFSILTLGIYRFWGRTHVRRFVWRHTALLDDALEYLGTGGELFIGFLIAVAVLLPVFAAYSLLQFLFADGPGHALLALEVLYYLVLFFLIQIAIHRMRRYRLTRTAWRGVRFGLGGSSLVYARISFGYGLLTAATLGLAYPWMRVATLGYFTRHAYLGTAGLALAPNAVWLFRRWLAVIAPPIAGLALFIALNLEMLENIRFFFEEGYDRAGGRAMLRLSFWPLLIYPIALLLWVWYRVAEFRHMVGCLRIGDTGFVSLARPKYVYWRILVFALAMAGIGALIGAMVISFVTGFVRTGAEPATIVIAAFVPFVVLVLFAGIVRTLLLDIPLLAHVCETLEVSNSGALEEVAQSSAAVPGYGEGTAEALDVGGF